MRRGGDGISDDWENAHGLNPNDSTDANQDADGDGQGNLQEYLAGTDPNNTASVLSITAVSRDAETEAVSLTFNSVIGRFYRLESTTDLTNPSSWTTLQDSIPASATGSTQITNSSFSGEDLRFYRIRVLTP